MPLIQRWSTDDVPDEHRFDYYADALTTSIDPMRVASRGPEVFGAEITSAELGAISVIQGVGSAHRCIRDRTDIARSSEHNFHLILNVASSWNLTHRDRIRLRPGDAVLLDSNYGHELLLPTFRIVHLKLPVEWIRQWLPNPGVLVGRPIRFDSNWGRALTSFVVRLSPEFVVGAPLPQTVIADQIGALLALVAHDIGDGLRHETAREANLRDRIAECIAQRRSEFSLTAADVSVSLGISARTLHRSLAASGRTFGEMLVDARLELAKRMLESAQFDRLTTAEIGRRAGFSDASHFARVLRRRLGDSPVDIRRRRDRADSRRRE